MTGSGAPLALPAEAFGEETGWRRRQHLVDALPYVDHITDEEREAAEKLIREEVRFEQVDGRSRRGWKRGARERAFRAPGERAGGASERGAYRERDEERGGRRERKRRCSLRAAPPLPATLASRMLFVF